MPTRQQVVDEIVAEAAKSFPSTGTPETQAIGSLVIAAVKCLVYHKCAALPLPEQDRQALLRVALMNARLNHWTGVVNRGELLHLGENLPMMAIIQHEVN